MNDNKPFTKLFKVAKKLGILEDHLLLLINSDFKAI